MLCRWGNAKSPAYGTLNDYQFMRRHTSSSKRAEKAKQCWGASLSKIDDVGKVFVKYAKGDHPDYFVLFVLLTHSRIDDESQTLYNAYCSSHFKRAACDKEYICLCFVVMACMYPIS